MARLILRVAPWLSVLAVALAWELFARSGAVTPFMLPKLTTVQTIQPGATLTLGRSPVSPSRRWRESASASLSPTTAPHAGSSIR